ncbi:hypothetical protein FRB96_006689 [Tulasnella sp. 330]|nr:hypothetical protein FRB96_006689 [Tulasnella sp. 330]
MASVESGLGDEEHPAHHHGFSQIRSKFESLARGLHTPATPAVAAPPTATAKALAIAPTPNPTARSQSLSPASSTSPPLPAQVVTFDGQRLAGFKKIPPPPPPTSSRPTSSASRVVESGGRSTPVAPPIPARLKKDSLGRADEVSPNHPQPFGSSLFPHSTSGDGDVPVYLANDIDHQRSRSPSPIPPPRPPTIPARVVSDTVVVQQPSAPPPPIRQPYSSRTPSPQPPLPLKPAGMPTWSVSEAPPTPSRSNVSLIKVATNDIFHHDVLNDSPATLRNGLLNDSPSTSRTTLALAGKEGRYSWSSEDPESTWRDQQQHRQQSSSSPQGTPPAPPPRPRPLIPPRPGTGSRNMTPPSTSTKPIFSGLPPPLPARQPDRTSSIDSDDGASSSSSPISTVPPPPPPRRPAAASTSTESPPPPPRPAATLPPAPPPRNNTVQVAVPAPPQQPQPLHHTVTLHSALHKAKKEAKKAIKTGIMPVPTERPASAAGSIRSHTLINNGDRAPILGGDEDERPILPPPVRSVSDSRQSPWTRTKPTGGAAEDDSTSESSSSSSQGGLKSAIRRVPLRAQSINTTAPRNRGIDDLPDSSRSNRRPPFASLCLRADAGDVLGVPAPAKSVTAIAGDLLCVGGHQMVMIYDLALFRPKESRKSALKRKAKQRVLGLPSVPQPTRVINLTDVGLPATTMTRLGGERATGHHIHISAMGFAPPRRSGDGGASDVGLGRYLWVGTRDGALIEVDTRTGEVTAAKTDVHRGVNVTHILRYKDAMVTLDEMGKALVFCTMATSDGGGGGDQDDDGWTDLGASLLNSATPRLVRIADRQAFACLLYGRLWTSVGSMSLGAGGSLESGIGAGGGVGIGAVGGAGGGTSAGSSSGSGRGSLIRVYDIFSVASAQTSVDSGMELPSPASGSPATATSVTSNSNKSGVLLPTESGVGAVTSATVLPTRPGQVYLGHEGGYITIWETSPPSSSTTTPAACVATLKISTSDILCLEGVHNRLWCGYRNGSISAYDVETKPWTVTNVWKHGGHQDEEAPWESGKAKIEPPVVRLMVDVAGAEKTGELTAISIGRDDMIRFWDGYLSANWIENELMKRESEFCSFRPVKMLVCTFNIDAAKPDALATYAGDSGVDNANFLENVLRSVDSPDILVFGFQEVIDLESKGLTAKTVLLGAGNSNKVSKAYKLWYDRLAYAVRVAMPPNQPYSVIHTENLVGLFTCIFIRNSEKDKLKDIAITTVKRGMGGHYGNKGAIVSRLVIDDSSICFINCHLAAGQSQKMSRNQDIAAVLEEKAAFPESRSDDFAAFAGGGDGSMILDHEFVFLNGDLNYRIDQRRDAVISSIRANELSYLLEHDQLLKEMKTNKSFRLRTFLEAPITFAPTYKYDRRSNEYDTSEKKRVPAWCDRILYRCREPGRVEALHYQRYEVNVSDHRPVSAGFAVRVRKVNQNARRQLEDLLEDEWAQEQASLVVATTSFYREVGMT